MYGVGLNIETNRILCDMRMVLQKKQGIALRQLSLCLYAADAQKSGALSPREFEKVLAHMQLFPSKVQLQALVKAFNSNGNVDIAAFLAALRPPLNERRCAIVRRAWDKVDPEATGCVSLAQLSEHYDVSRNSDFIEGTLTKEQIFQSFVDGLNFDGRAVS